MRFIIFTLIFSFNIQANIKTCYTHGDCQSTTATGTKCFLAKTGTDIYGAPTCATRCIQVDYGQYCEQINSEVFGYCREESITPMPNIDPSDPDRCKDAVDMFPIVSNWRFINKVLQENHSWPEE